MRQRAWEKCLRFLLSDQYCLSSVLGQYHRADAVSWWSAVEEEAYEEVKAQAQKTAVQVELDDCSTVASVGILELVLE